MTMEPAAQSLPSENGYYPLAPGKLAALTIYYQRLAPFIENTLIWPDTVAIRQLGQNDIAEYRQAFEAVGARWLWVSRLDYTDEQLSALLSDPDIEAFTIEQGGAIIGLLEVDFREKRQAEIVYIGLVETATGSGIGRVLLGHALLRAKARHVERVWLHTCQFDSPQAAKFYESQGFKAFKLAVEILDDPRHQGKLRREVAPHVPFIAASKD
jgi:N-acetylglutamate synthase-like GNAT family acetyltransferase